MTNKRFPFKPLSLLVVLAVFLSTFCATLPSVNAPLEEHGLQILHMQ